MPRFKEAKISADIVKTILRELQHGPKTRYELRFKARPLGDVQLKNTLRILTGIGLVQAQQQPYRGKVPTKTQYALSHLGKEVLHNNGKQKPKPKPLKSRKRN